MFDTPESVDPIEIKKSMDKINAKFGEKTIFIASKGLKPVTYISTGVHQLDTILGGGLPKGRICMIYGPEGAGKTSFCMHMAARYPISLYVDAERSFNQERADIFGVDLARTILLQPDTGEEAMSSVIEMAKVVPLIIVDSVASLVPKKEYELENEVDKVPGIALTAGILNRKLNPLNNICYKSGCTVIFINQVRDKFGAIAFGEQVVLPGGHALKHTSHWIMKVGRKETIHVSEQAVGITCRFAIGNKNRSAAPFQQCDVHLIFDKGFVDFNDLEAEKKAARKRYLSSKKEKSKEVIHEGE